MIIIISWSKQKVARKGNKKKTKNVVPNHELAREPIGSQAGRSTGSLVQTSRTSWEQYFLSTTTSNTNSLNLKSKLVTIWVQQYSLVFKYSFRIRYKGMCYFGVMVQTGLVFLWFIWVHGMWWSLVNLLSFKCVGEKGLPMKFFRAIKQRSIDPQLLFFFNNLQSLQGQHLLDYIFIFH